MSILKNLSVLFIYSLDKILCNNLISKYSKFISKDCVGIRGLLESISEQKASLGPGNIADKSGDKIVGKFKAGLGFITIVEALNIALSINPSSNDGKHFTG